MLPNFLEDNVNIDLEYMRVNIEDEAHVKIDLAFPQAYDFIDDAIECSGASPLYHREELRFKKQNSMHFDSLDYSKNEETKRQRVKTDLQVYNMDGFELDFKTGKKVPRTKMTNLTAFKIEKQLQEMDTNPNNRNVVFVHCAMGRSRSATCVIMYIMKKFGISY